MTTVTVETVQRAQDIAQQAARKAEEATRALQAAQDVAEAERQKRFTIWAEGIISRFDGDLATAEAALTKARRHFERTAVHEPSETVASYLAWARAWGQYRGVITGLHQALGRLKRESFRGGAIPSSPTRGLPPYAESVTAAIAAEASMVMNEPDERLHERLAAIGEGTDDGR